MRMIIPVKAGRDFEDPTTRHPARRPDVWMEERITFGQGGRTDGEGTPRSIGARHSGPPRAGDGLLGTSSGLAHRVRCRSEGCGFRSVAERVSRPRPPAPPGRSRLCGPSEKRGPSSRSRPPRASQFPHLRHALASARVRLSRPSGVPGRPWGWGDSPPAFGSWSFIMARLPGRAAFVLEGARTLRREIPTFSGRVPISRAPFISSTWKGFPTRTSRASWGRACSPCSPCCSSTGMTRTWVGGCGDGTDTSRPPCGKRTIGEDWPPACGIFGQSLTCRRTISHRFLSHGVRGSGEP